MKKISFIFTLCIMLCISSILQSCLSDSRQEPAETPTPVQSPVPEVPRTEEFTVTEELYNETFEDVESLILKLNDIIRKKDYMTWTSYLASEYIDYYSTETVLRNISNEFYKRRGIRLNLKNLEDYFDIIVVGSRIDANLDKIEFQDENHLIALSIINDKPYVLYYLQKVGNDWKIAIW